MTLSIVEAAAAAQEPLDADALATEGTWAPKNDTDVEWAFEQAGEARAYIASVKAQLADLVNRANARAEAIMAPALNRATYFEGRVAEYAQVNKDKLLVGKKKSREYIGGTIAWRKHPGKLVVTDEAALLAWLPSQDIKLFKVKVSPVMAELKKMVEETGVIPDGCNWIEATEELTCKSNDLPTLTAPPTPRLP